MRTILSQAQGLNVEGYDGLAPARGHIDFKAYLEENAPYEADKLLYAGNFEKQFMAEVERKGRVYGDPLPWEKTFDKVRFKPVGLSLWMGYNGHRKSLLTTQVAMCLAKQKKICIASFEMPPEQTLLRMARQWCGGYPSKPRAARFIEWANEQVIIYDESQTVSPQKLQGMAYYAIKELGAEHVFIDSLTKCGIRGDDLDGQKGLIDRLAWMSKETGTGHIHMVCHARKGDEDRIPNRYEIRGASEISDLADNVFICWANKQKKMLADKAIYDPGDMNKKELEILKKADQILRVDKQRGERFESDIYLNFDSDSFLFN